MDKQKKLRALRIASKKEDEEKVNEILEELEDGYHIDLTSFYGEDFDAKKTKQLEKRLK